MTHALHKKKNAKQCRTTRRRKNKQAKLLSRGGPCSKHVTSGLVFPIHHGAWTSFHGHTCPAALCHLPWPYVCARVCTQPSHMCVASDFHRDQPSSRAIPVSSQTPALTLIALYWLYLALNFTSVECSSLCLLVPSLTGRSAVSHRALVYTVYLPSSLPGTLLYNCSHVLFIQSTADGHLGSFQFGMELL